VSVRELDTSRESPQHGKIGRLTPLIRLGKEPERTFEIFTLLGRKVHTQNKKGVRKEYHESGISERGLKEDSSFRLNAPEIVVTKLTVPILLEHGTPTISAEI